MFTKRDRKADKTDFNVNLLKKQGFISAASRQNNATAKYTFSALIN